DADDAVDAARAKPVGVRDIARKVHVRAGGGEGAGHAEQRDLAAAEELRRAHVLDAVRAEPLEGHLGHPAAGLDHPRFSFSRRIVSWPWRTSATAWRGPRRAIVTTSATATTNSPSARPHQMPARPSRSGRPRY